MVPGDLDQGAALDEESRIRLVSTISPGRRLGIATTLDRIVQLVSLVVIRSRSAHAPTGGARRQPLGLQSVESVFDGVLDLLGRLLHSCLRLISLAFGLHSPVRGGLPNDLLDFAFRLIHRVCEFVRPIP